MFRSKGIEKYIISESKEEDNIFEIRHTICKEVRLCSGNTCSDDAGKNTIDTDTVGCNECDCFYAQYNKFNNIDKFIATLREDNIITKEDAFRYALTI